MEILPPSDRERPEAIIKLVEGRAGVEREGLQGWRKGDCVDCVEKRTCWEDGLGPKYHK